MPIHADGYLIPFTGAEVTAMQIETFEVRNGAHPTEARRRDESTMTRTFFVKWEERFHFVELVLGNSKTWVDTGTTKLSRLLPDSQFGRHPDSTQIMATRIEYIRGHGVGIDNAGQFPTYPKAEVQVFYEFAPFTAQSDAGLTSERQRFVTLGDTSRSEAEAFGPIPGGAFKYTNAGATGFHGKPAPYNFSIVRAVERFTLWWEFLPWDLVSTNGALFTRLYYGENDGGGDPDGVPLIGTVNSEQLDLPSIARTYDPGTLLLESTELVKIRSPLAESGTTGLRARVGLNYAFAPRGWLDFWVYDPATPANSALYRLSNAGTYHAVNAVPDYDGLYCVRDHAKIFDPNY